jgi:hypothetical protein
MDLAELKQKLDRSREIEASVQGAKFRLKLPSEHAWRLATEEHSDTAGNVKRQRVSRALVESSLVGWEGVKAEHFMKGGGEDAMPFSPDACAVLLDERQDIADELVMLLVKRLNERRKDVEQARKNSSRASSGT